MTNQPITTELINNTFNALLVVYKEMCGYDDDMCPEIFVNELDGEFTIWIEIITEIQTCSKVNPVEQGEDKVIIKEIYRAKFNKHDATKDLILSINEGVNSLYDYSFEMTKY